MKLASGLLLLIANSAFACFIPPKHLAATPEELIDRTRSISLATVVRAEISGKDVLYTFRTIRPIRGKSERQFQIRGDAQLYPMQNWDFENHTEKNFWSSRVGRLTMHPDCKVHPSFSVGGIYLAFLDQPYHAKSFEIIHVVSGERQDKWLKYVLGRARR